MTEELLISYNHFPRQKPAYVCELQAWKPIWHNNYFPRNIFANIISISSPGRRIAIIVRLSHD